jgi:hypothetical protein
MAYDYAERLYDFPTTFTTFARTTLRLSGEGLRLWQSCRSPHGVGGFSFPRLICGGFHRGGVGAAGGSGLIGAAFFAFYMYSTFSFKFSDGGKHQEKT